MRRLFLSYLLLGLMSGVVRAQVTEDQKLTGSDGGDFAEFGRAVALVETEAEAFALVGAPGDAEIAENAGAVYAYRYDEASGRWVEEAKFWPEEVGENAIIGRALALSDDGRLAFISGAEPGPDSAPRFGRVHVFRRESGTWIEESTLAASDETPRNGFGCSVTASADGAVVAVGACQADGPRPRTGAVYIYRRDETAGVWEEEAKLATERLCFFNVFGHAVSVSAAGDRIAVGEKCGEGGDPPALHFFHQVGSPSDPNGGWVREAVFGTVAEGVGWGGVALSAEGDYALVGTWYEHVAIFEREGTSWTETGSITASDGSPGLGDDAISLNGHIALMGDRNAEVQGENAGAVYLFRRMSDGAWAEETVVAASDGTQGDDFGNSVALSAHLGLVGAPQHGATETFTGAAYAFGLSRIVSAGPQPVLADTFDLAAFPNPFVSTLTVTFTLPQPDHVRVALYDVLGREVTVLLDAHEAAGGHQVQFKARYLSAGIYFVLVETGSHSVSRRVALSD